METVGLEDADQNQGDHSQEIVKCGRALDNTQDRGGGTSGTVGHTMLPGEVERASWRW